MKEKKEKKREKKKKMMKNNKKKNDLSYSIFINKKIDIKISFFKILP